jgi:hypothetical protein
LSRVVKLVSFTPRYTSRIVKKVFDYSS